MVTPVLACGFLSRQLGLALPLLADFRPSFLLNSRTAKSTAVKYQIPAALQARHFNIFPVVVPVRAVPWRPGCVRYHNIITRANRK